MLFPQLCRIVTCLIAFLGISFTTHVAAEGKRVALVIGNSKYEHVSNLSNPTNDAEDIAAVLSGMGFNVIKGLDLDYRDMRLALRDFSQVASGAEVALVYFAGHGVEIDNSNYLIPVNAELTRDLDIEFEAIRLDAVVNAISSIEGLKIILLDACRNNPFLSDMVRTTATRSIGRGLGRIDPGGVLVGYAARGGTLALDGGGRNSPYAKAVLKHIDEPGLELGKMFRKIRDSVYDSTNGQQEPFTYGSLPGEDIFLVPVNVPAPTVSALGSGISAELETQMIRSYRAAESSDRLYQWRAFLKKWGEYEDHPFVKIALTRKTALAEGEEESRRRRALNEPWIDFETASDGETALTLEERALVQKSILYLGVDVGGIDGQFGPQTRRAISAARVRMGMNPGVQIDRRFLSLLPDPKALDKLMSGPARYYELSEFDFVQEPRIQKVAAALGRMQFRFGYFSGKLYVAALSGTNSGWVIANAKARAAGGYLATISSPVENEFIYYLVKDDDRYWRFSTTRQDIFGPAFGLYQLPGSREPSGGWTWVSGEPLSYSNWGRGEPNNYSNKEKIATFTHRSPNGGYFNKIETSPKWSDMPDVERGYIIEMN